MRPEYYVAIVDRLKREYGLETYDAEHEFIREFYEGPIPVFKLIMTAPGEDGTPSVMLISFHIELDATAAIQWFLRVRSLDPHLHIAACYLKDAEGTSYVGEDAEILKMYMIEQDVIAAFIASDKDAADVLGQKLPGLEPSPLKQFATYREALREFSKMQKRKGDISH